MPIAIAKRMKEDKETSMAEKSQSQITLGIEELKALISSSTAEAVAQAVQASTKVIADAMIESRKPYKDPLQTQNEEMMRQSMREVQERINRQIEASKDSCPHLQGSNELSEFQGQLQSFVLHQLDTGEVIGICTNCQKLIRSTNDGRDGRPDDREFFKRKSANRLSRAGQRMFMDPTKAQLAR